MKFESLPLHPELHNNIAGMGFRRPTDIQYKAILPILKGDDVLAIAQTGTGKTAAFAIPAVELLMQRPRRKDYDGVRCLIMEPTHELAHQVGQVTARLCAATGLTTLAVYGGVEQDTQIDRLTKKVDIVVATPGRMFDLKSQGYLDVSGCEILILDEADHMLDLGFIDDIRQLVRSLPRRRQTLFFSATIDEKIKRLAYSLVNKAVHIRISPKNAVSRNVTHTLLRVGMDEKRFYLERIVREHPDSRIMVFVRTRVRAERVKAAMERVGIEAVNMHGDKSQKERSAALQQFAGGRVKMLIATDVSARGIDIPSVDYVINYDVPDVPENYVHRVGRTGRGMDNGFALTFCAPEEEPVLAGVEEYLGGNIDEIKLSREEQQETLDLQKEAEADWESLIEENLRFEDAKRRKRRR